MSTRASSIESLKQVLLVFLLPPAPPPPDATDQSFRPLLSWSRRIVSLSRLLERIGIECTDFAAGNSLAYIPSGRFSFGAQCICTFIRVSYNQHSSVPTMAWLIYQVAEGVGTVQEVLRITGIHTGDWSVDLAEPNNVEKMRL